MNANDLGFTNKEKKLINERYPDIDLEHLHIPISGFSTINSLDYLDSMIGYDLEHDNFNNCINPCTSRNICTDIKEKIKEFKKHGKI